MGGGLHDLSHLCGGAIAFDFVNTAFYGIAAFAGWDHLCAAPLGRDQGSRTGAQGNRSTHHRSRPQGARAAGAREAVQAVLDQKASGLHSTTMPSVLELGRVPISVAVKHPQFGRYLGSAILRIVIVAAAFIYIIQIPAMREFDGRCIRRYFSLLR